MSAQLVADVNPGLGSSDPLELTTFGKSIFFTALSPDVTDDLVSSLYVSDGTPAGTHVMRTSGVYREGSNGQYGLIVGGGQLFFGEEQDYVTNIYRSDGTAVGTKSIWSSGDVVANPLAFVQNRLFFTTGAAPGSFLSVPGQLVATNNNFKGNTVVMAFDPDSFITKAATINNNLVFTLTKTDGSTQVWRSDGTRLGTVMLVDHAQLNYTASVGSTLYFTTTDSTTEDLWRTDGAKAGTSLVKHFSERGSGEMVAAGQSVVLQARDAAHGNELWSSDGTPAGTRLLADVRHGQKSSNPAQLAALNGAVYFGADNGAIGRELWRTDGTGSGTKLVKEIAPGAAGANFTEIRAAPSLGRIFFSEASTAQRGMWTSDGTAAGTIRVADAHPSSFNEAAVVMGDSLYYVGSDATHGNELWTIRAKSGSVAGNLFRDANGNGTRDAGEAALVGWRVFLDLNGDLIWQRKEPSTRTSITGRYQLDDVTVGRYTVRVTTLGGYFAAAPVRADIGEFKTTTKRIAVVPAATIRGSVFDDANHNGVRDAGERGVAGFRVFLDLNRNAHFDLKRDLFVRTDADGNFEFSDLRAGEYRLRITEVGSWAMTTAKSFSTTVAPGGSSSKRFGVRRA